jgi:hypothetical protein
MELWRILGETDIRKLSNGERQFYNDSDLGFPVDAASRTTVIRCSGTSTLHTSLHLVPSCLLITLQTSLVMSRNTLVETAA